MITDLSISKIPLAEQLRQCKIFLQQINLLREILFRLAESAEKSGISGAAYSMSRISNVCSYQIDLYINFIEDRIKLLEKENVT